MRHGAALLAFLLTATALPALAESVDRSPRPLPRPAAISVPADAPVVTASSASAPVVLLRPRARPAALEKAVTAFRATSAKAAPAGLDLTALAAAAPAPDGPSLRPRARPADLVTKVSAPQSAPAPEGRKKRKAAPEDASPKGSVCGVAAIKGEKIAPITSRVKGCGLAEGVRVTSVSGVRLSIPATIDCATAKALNAWVRDVAQPAYGGDLVELRIAGHYICRPRNNVKGAKVSEHGRGKAVDIAGFVLASGKVEMVVNGYGKTMRAVHKKACGLFNTTLGPGSDGYHEDHLHFDTASGRGPYCR